MAPAPFVAPVTQTTAVFQPNIFAGKVLFCTGGGSGICKNMTEAIMNHGAKAAILGRQLDRVNAAAKELTSKTGQECLALQCDVRDPKSMHEAAAKTVEKFGKIDFVICGAAGNFLAPISQLSEKGFRTVIEIDALGTYHTVKATLPFVRKAHGSYIHVSATQPRKPTPFQVHVTAAKAAINSLSDVLAVEEGPHGVRSNVISPGLVGDTEGADRLTMKGSKSTSTEAPPYPLGRIGVMQDVAAAAVFLFSDAASFITGQNLVVDGAATYVSKPELPYPQSVLDPASVQGNIKPRM